MAKNTIKKYRISKGIFDQYILGIPAYKDSGISVYFTGTNAEANTKCRELTQAETEPGIIWNLLDAVEVEG